MIKQCSVVYTIKYCQSVGFDCIEERAMKRLQNRWKGNWKRAKVIADVLDDDHVIFIAHSVGGRPKGVRNVRV